MNKNSVLTIIIALICTALLHSSRVMASDPADIHTLKVNITNAMTSFYMYQGLDADLKYANRIDQAMAAASAAASRILSGSDNDIDQNGSAELINQWDTFNSLMASNRKDIVTRGYPDIRLVNEMGDACSALIDAADNLKKTEKVSDVTRLARALAFRMSDITSQYTGRGTSNLGQVFVGYQQKSPKEQAEEFTLLLDQLDGAIPKEDALRVSAIRHKWEFLSRSISNYNENSVPFLVVNYNDSIVEALHQLAASYD